MRRLTSTAALAGLAATLLVAPAAAAVPGDSGSLTVPERTQIAVGTPFGPIGTPDMHEARPALSIVKLYMVDYIWQHGDGTDNADLERMIKASDDAAAQRMWDKYGPVSVSAPAEAYGLTSTWPGDNWGTSYTSTADVTTFLNAKMLDPNTPILGWMRDADPVAADGTEQNWGTSHVPGVQGTKWGWSDYGDSEVASASFGLGFTIAANTWGFPDDQTADVLNSVNPAAVIAPSA